MEELERLRQWVMIRLDELKPGIEPAAPVIGLERELDEAALFILRHASREIVLEACVDATEPVVVKQERCVKVGVPADFVRFMRIRLKGWRSDVNWLTGVQTPIYTEQSNEYTASTASAPIASIVPWRHKVGEKVFTRAIECYPGSSVQIEQFLYVPKLTAVEMPDVLKDPLVWLTASRVFQLMREGDLSQLAMQRFGSTLNTVKLGILGEENVEAQ